MHGPDREIPTRGEERRADEEARRVAQADVDPVLEAEHIADPVLARGLRMLVWDGAFAQAMGALTGGAVLVAFALSLGASNATIGLLAAVGPLFQLLQLPAVALVERLRHRKLIALIGSGGARVTLLALATAPWFVPEDHLVTALVVALALHAALGTISACASTSWQRDLVPDEMRGRFFGRRMAVSTAVGAGLTLVVGVVLTAIAGTDVDDEVFALLFAVGAVLGLVGLGFVGRIPEPEMGERAPGALLARLAQPFRQANFRALLVYTGAWSFAINLAAPFVTVYMLERMGLGVGTVMAFAAFGQLCNVVAFRMWGRLADRFSNKSVLGLTCGMLVFTNLFWPVAGHVVEHHGNLVPALAIVALLHLVGGVATAGMLLGSSTIAMELAPRGQGTGFLAANTIVAGLASAVAPLLAGLAADALMRHEVSIVFRYGDLGEGTGREFTPLALRGLDFLFVASFVVGQYALHRLLAVREEGDVRGRVLLLALRREVTHEFRQMSSIPGLRLLTAFPYAILRERRPRGGGPPAA
jgi:MFS family permease